MSVKQSPHEEYDRGFSNGWDAARAQPAQAVPPDPRPVIEMCAKALAEELAAWDIDPPLHHVKEASDACEAWLASQGAKT